jgi:hypothetical protein
MTIDKSELMIQTLDRYEIRYNPGRNAEQSIHCPNQDGHARGDKRPSCSLNLGKGVLFCQGCGLSGDAYSVIMQIEGIDFKQVTEQLGKPMVIIESDFLF